MRYLTSEEKAREIATWSHKLDDEGVGQLLAPLNAIDGVCTVQSCIGHVKRTSEVERYVENGCIELRLDEKRTRLFYAAMPAIAELPGYDALVAVLSGSGIGARLDPNPGAMEATCR